MRINDFVISDPGHSEEDRYTLLIEHIKQIIDEIEKLKVITVKNGGGRHITMNRADFYQFLYDLPRERFNRLSDISSKSNAILDFVLKIALIIGTVALVLHFTVGKGIGS